VALVETAQEFADRLDKLYGLYLDTTLGFKANLDVLKNGQEASAHLVSDPTELYNLPVFIGRGDPNNPNNVLLYQTTQGKFKARNAPGGANYRLLSQYFVVLAFHLWEHEYRPRIASLFGLKEADEFKMPIFGDIRLLRNEILKHRGVLTKDTVKKLQVVGGLQVGGVIDFSGYDLEQLVHTVKAALDNLVQSATGTDPKLRTVWHV